jgi:predicted Zn-dependent peptidase
MKNILVAATFAAFMIISLRSQAQKELPPKGGPAKDFRLSAKSTGKLSNGLKTTFVSYGDIPKVTIRLIISTGGIHEEEDETGLAELTAEMLRQGSTTMNFKTLSDKVARMGGALEVYSSKEAVTVSGSVLSEYAPELIKIIADILINPAFPESEIERLKDNLKRQLAVNQTVPQSIAWDNFSRTVFGNTSLGRVFSKPEIINGFTKAKVAGFYARNFGASRSSLYVVGVFDPAKVKEAIAKSLTAWKAGPPPFTPPVKLVAKRDTIVIDRKNSPQTTVILGLTTIPPNDKDYVGLEVLDALLGGAFGSRIVRNIREDKGYTYSPYSELVNRKGISVWSQNADITTEHTIDALKEIDKEIRTLQQTPPPGDELKGVQNYLSGLFVLRNSSPGGIINQLNFLDKHGLPDSYLSDYVKNINKITPKEITAAAKKYIDLSKMTVVMVGNKEVITKQSEVKRAF